MEPDQGNKTFYSTNYIPFITGNGKRQVPWMKEVHQDLKQSVESVKKICRKEGSLKKDFSEAKTLSEENLRRIKKNVSRR